MQYGRFNGWLCGLVLALLPHVSEAALQDWYGAWSVAYTGDDTGTCDVIISQTTDTQATIIATSGRVWQWAARTNVCASRCSSS